MSRYRTVDGDTAERDMLRELWQLAVGALERECPVTFALWWECQRDATPETLAARLHADPARVVAAVDCAAGMVERLHADLAALVLPGPGRPKKGGSAGHV